MGQKLKIIARAKAENTSCIGLGPGPGPEQRRALGPGPGPCKNLFSSFCPGYSFQLLPRVFLSVFAPAMFLFFSVFASAILFRFVPCILFSSWPPLLFLPFGQGQLGPIPATLFGFPVLLKKRGYSCTAWQKWKR